jgi:hypothetical protein
MSTLAISIPDTFFPDLTSAAALIMVDSENVTIAAIATRVVASEIVTETEKTAMLVEYVQDTLRTLLVEYRASVAAQAERDDPTNTW